MIFLINQVLRYLSKGLLVLIRISNQLNTIIDLLTRLLAAVEPLPAAGFVFFDSEGNIIEGELNVTNSQKVTITIQPVNKRGPAAVDGIPEWSVSDATILSLNVASDGMSAEVAAVGPTGSADVAVTGDADLGEGVMPIFGKLTLSVTPGMATEFKMIVSDPVEQ